MFNDVIGSRRDSFAGAWLFRVLLLGVFSVPAVALELRPLQEPVQAVTAPASSPAVLPGMTITVLPTCPPAGEAPYPPGTTIVGNEIRFLPGASIAWFDIFVSDWSVGLASAGETGATAGSALSGSCCSGGFCTFAINSAACIGSFILGGSCPESGQCDIIGPIPDQGTYPLRVKFGAVPMRKPPGSVCQGNPLACDLFGFIDVARLDILHPSVILRFAQETGKFGGDFKFYSESNFANAAQDVSLLKYFGTFSVSADALGSVFSTGSMPVAVDCPDVTLFDQYNRPIPCMNSVPASLVVLLVAAEGGGAAAGGSICAGTVPAVSEWGLVVLALLGLAVGSVAFRCRGPVESAV